jgi:hypothetical protein
MQAPVASFWLANDATQTLEFHSCSNERAGADWLLAELSVAQGSSGWVATHRAILEGVSDLWLCSPVWGAEPHCLPRGRVRPEAPPSPARPLRPRAGEGAPWHARCRPATRPGAGPSLGARPRWGSSSLLNRSRESAGRRRRARRTGERRGPPSGRGRPSSPRGARPTRRSWRASPATCAHACSGGEVGRAAAPSRNTGLLVGLASVSSGRHVGCPFDG